MNDEAREEREETATDARNAIVLLTEKLESAESELVGLNFGCTASVELEPGMLLEFTKKNNVWGLYVSGKSGQQQRIRSCSRKARVLIAKVLPQIQEILTSEAKKTIAEVEEAIQLVDDFLQAFADAKKPENEKK